MEWRRDAHGTFTENQYIVHAVVSGMRRQRMGADSIAPPLKPAGPRAEVGSSVSRGYKAATAPILLVAAAVGDDDKTRALLARGVGGLE